MIGNGLASSPSNMPAPYNAGSFPNMVQRALPFCGSSKISGHTFVFLEGVEAVLQTDASFQNGSYTEQPTRGLRAVSRVYAGWGFSQAFHWDHVYKDMGFSARLYVDLAYS